MPWAYIAAGAPVLPEAPRAVPKSPYPMLNLRKQTISG